MPADFFKLSRAGQLRRLNALAAEALSHYDLPGARFTYYTFNTNLLYRVVTASGEAYMLRLASPGWRELPDLQAEVSWLDALARDTPLAVPRIARTRDGEGVFPARHPGVPVPWNATLMSWVPGRLLGHSLTAGNLEKMGALFAQLHSHAAGWQPPAGFSTRRFEHWLSRGEPNAVIGAGGECVLSSPHRDLLTRMHCRVEAEYAALDRSDLRVIHCDLWHNNIKLDRGVLRPFDFEDTVWGFRAHDIAMAMLDLLETVGEAAYPTLLAAFRRGYEQHLPWPEARIEPFQAGRLLWKINWAASHQVPWLNPFIADLAPVFEHFERTGGVILPVKRG